MLNNKVIYQIYPKSFKDSNHDGYGDINGIIEKLDYLQALGVDYLWLSPHLKSPQKDNGYDISDYYQVDQLFGTNEDYENLIAQANKRNIKIMMDLVLNHTSDQHEWFKKAKLKDPKYYDFYIWRDEPNDIQSFFGGSAWEYCEEVGKYYLHLFAKEQPDLNWQNSEVKKELYKMVNYWIDKGVEGFRLDVIDLIGKDIDKQLLGQAPDFIPNLQDLNHHTFKKELLTVGECWGATLQQAKQMCNDDGLTQAFNFNAITICDGESKWDEQPFDLHKLVEQLDIWQNQYQGIEANVMNNHDSPRLITRWMNDDKYRKESAMALISLFGLLKGNLYIYQGEEIGMSNAYFNHIDDYQDIESINFYNEQKAKGVSETQIMYQLSRVSRDNARIVMRWDDSEYAGFSDVKPWINMGIRNCSVQDDLNSDNSVYRYYQKIIKFKKEHEVWLSEPIAFEIIDDAVLIAKRKHFIIVVNFSDKYHYYQNDQEICMANYQSINNAYLRPYEARVILNK